MKVISYSDLHLEFYNEEETFTIPEKISEEADILVLAGDICCFNKFDKLRDIFDQFIKLIIYISGNHEYYGSLPINEANQSFKEWIKDLYPHVHFLNNEEYSHNGVHFFGGTMWTDFNNKNIHDMLDAQGMMNDYRRIRIYDGQLLRPAHTTEMHAEFVKKITEWFEKPLEGPRVVVSHHCPIEQKKDDPYKDSKVKYAYHSLDMIPIIEEYQPDLWVYGHTHFTDDRKIGKTRIISNPAGYKNYAEVWGFDWLGKIVAV